jgi:hypothetical protein
MVYVSIRAKEAWSQSLENDACKGAFAVSLLILDDVFGFYS